MAQSGLKLPVLLPQPQTAQWQVCSATPRFLLLFRYVGLWDEEIEAQRQEVTQVIYQQLKDLS